MSVALNGWHPGERAIRARLGLDKGPSATAYTWIAPEMPEQHRIFYSRNLPFIPLTTLDAQGRPWASFAVSADKPGERGFVASPKETELVMRVTAPLGDPLIENLDRIGDNGHVLVAGLGIELETRRRNKFAGRAVSVQTIGEQARQVSLQVNEAIGNCPKYINVRELEPCRDIKPEIVKHVQDMDTATRLSAEAIELIREADTVFFGTTYSATPSDEQSFPSHVGMNARSGRPGFVRVLPSDARTIVIPDYSGNRIMTSLGNVEKTPFAAASVVDFETGDVLYVTGIAKNLLGEEAQRLMPRQNVLTTLHVESFVHVRNSIPFRQRPGSDVGRSPYSPPIRYLAEEMTGSNNLVPSDSEITLTLTRITLHSPTLGTFSFEASAPISIRAGQAAALDFTPLMGSQQYQHMASAGMEARLNDDRIRTWTVAGIEVWPSKESDANSTHPKDADKDENTRQAQILNLTMREIPQGFITGALFSIARHAALKMPDVLEDARPLSLKVKLSGISGTFTLSKDVASQPQVKFLWLAGGVGVTPFLAMLRSLSEGTFAPQLSIDIVLVLATREPDVLLALVYAAIRGGGKPKLASPLSLTIRLFAGENAKLIAVPAMDDLVSVDMVDQKRRFSELGNEGLSTMVGDAPDRTAYLCGPPGFEEAVMRMLSSAGVEASKVIRESFNY